MSVLIRFAGEIGTERIRRRTGELHRYCRKVFAERVPWAEILSPEDERLRTAIFAFHIPGADHRELVRRAWEDCGIIIQWRIVDLVTGKEGVRVSLNWFIREEEIDRLAEEIVTLTGEGL